MAWSGMSLRKGRTIGIVGMVVVLLVALAGIQRMMERDTFEVIPTDVVRRGPLLVKITEVGEMQALNAQPIVGPFWGRIAWLIPEGTVVQGGDPVLKMDTGEIEKDFEKAHTAIDCIIFLVDKLEPNLTKDESNRLRTLITNLQMNYANQVEAK